MRTGLDRGRDASPDAMAAAVDRARRTRLEAIARRVQPPRQSGRTLASWPSLKTDIRNAGGNWVDEEVHVDGNIVSSRKPADLPVFCTAMVERFATGSVEGRSAA